MKLIVGIGNPGKEYAHNRHNVGFHCVSELARRHDIAMKKHQCQSLLGTGVICGQQIMLAKPETYVNNSGNAVSQIVRKYRIAIDDLLVICDDLDLPLGKLRIRQGGSSGGHKGLKSIIAAIGSQEFSRIRIGIGRPYEEGSSDRDLEAVVNHVLSDFDREEKLLIKPVILKAADAVECILSNNITAAMNIYN
jgi:PTH1 family peptidyl-tRNA hydrolase